MQAIFLIFCQCLISGNKRGERKNFLQIKICKIGVKILFSAVIPEYFFITLAVQQIVRGDRNFSAASGKVNNEMGVRHSGTPPPQISQLVSLAEHGKPKPVIIPRLVDMKEAATILGIGLSNFKRLEAGGAFPFQRKMVGSSVRYRNTDLYEFLLSV